MSLVDEIGDLSWSGKIPKQFRVADIRQHLRKYSDNPINTVLANHAEGTGHQAKRGRRPRFRRVAPGLYEVLYRQQ